MRTTIDLPPTLIRAAKARAAEQGESLKDLVNRAVAHEIGLPATPRGKTGRVTLPLIAREAELPAALPHIDGATLHATDDHTIDLDMPRAMDLNRVFASLGDAGIRVRSMRTKSNRLEELFVRLTGDDDRASASGAAP